MDEWERKELDKQTPEVVALALHKKRKEYQEQCNLQNDAYAIARQLEVEYERATKKAENLSYECKMLSREVSDLDDYLNSRLQNGQ